MRVSASSTPASNLETGQPDSPAHADPSVRPLSTGDLNIGDKQPGDFPGSRGRSDFRQDILRKFATFQMGSEAQLSLYGKPGPKRPTGNLEDYTGNDDLQHTGQTVDVVDFSNFVSDAFFNELGEIPPDRLTARGINVFSNADFHRAYDAAYAAAVQWDRGHNNGGIRTPAANLELVDRMIKAGLTAWTAGVMEDPFGGKHTFFEET